jgi:hypothetical protein
MLLPFLSLFPVTFRSPSDSIDVSKPDPSKPHLKAILDGYLVTV